MQQLNSQVSYMTLNQALLTFYADYIVGWHANYQKWYFATQLNLDNAVEQAHNLSLQYLWSTHHKNLSKNQAEKSLNTTLKLCC